ncbi:hypothetical protein Q4595_24555, partial [Wenyingzhuangia sp. 1_MG-2023]|nr:hypothetical protein [Wenyingzhuangia sp. 1_MG-2023]
SQGLPGARQKRFSNVVTTVCQHSALASQYLRTITANDFRRRSWGRQTASHFRADRYQPSLAPPLIKRCVVEGQFGGVVGTIIADGLTEQAG